MKPADPDPPGGLDLDAIEARAAAAAGGPWEVDESSEGWCGELRAGPNRQPVAQFYDGFMADARFAAAARTDVPKLLTALRAARAESAARLAWLDRDRDEIRAAAREAGVAGGDAVKTAKRMANVIVNLRGEVQRLRGVFRWQEVPDLFTGALRKVLVVGRGALQRVVRRCPVCSGSPNGSDPGDARE